MSYDMNKREIIIVFSREVGAWSPGKQLKFSDVLSFKEQTFEDLTDDDCMDSIMGLHQLSKNTYCVHTEKREFIFRTGNKPVSIDLDK